MKRIGSSQVAVWALAASIVGGTAFAQSTGSMTSPSSGSGAAGSSPTGTVLPSTIQSSSTAPTQPGHTVTGDRPSRAGNAYASPRASSADDAYRALDSANHGYVTREEVRRIDGFSFDAADTNRDGRVDREEFARAWNGRR